MSPFFGVGFLLSGVRYGMGRGVLQIPRADSALRGLHRLPVAIRQGYLYGRHQVDSVGAGCALYLRGIGCRIVFRGEATTDHWRGRPVGVRGR